VAARADVLLGDLPRADVQQLDGVPRLDPGQLGDVVLLEACGAALAGSYRLVALGLRRPGGIHPGGAVLGHLVALGQCRVTLLLDAGEVGLRGGEGGLRLGQLRAELGKGERVGHEDHTASRFGQSGNPHGSPICSTHALHSRFGVPTTSGSPEMSRPQLARFSSQQ
jgi:hypothetical protein